MSSFCHCLKKLRDLMRRNFDQFMRSFSKLNGEKTGYPQEYEPEGDTSMMRSTPADVSTGPSEHKIDKPAEREVPGLLEELSGDKIESRPEDGGLKEQLESKPIKHRTQSEITEDHRFSTKENRGNALEFQEEYEQKRQRDTEWDQSDYDNADWEDNNDIDEIKVYNQPPKKPIDLRGDTYVNDLLAAKGTEINPDAEFIPPRIRNNKLEEVEYEDLTPQLRPRPNYHGDTDVNKILESRNTPINPDAEFIPPSSRYATPVEVHYGYEIEDDEDIVPVDLTRDIEVNKILAAKSAPTNPNAEMFDFNNKESNANIKPVSFNQGEYFGDTYVNEILKKQGAPMNPYAEFLNPPHREANEHKQRGQYAGDTYVNEVLASRGTQINPNAEMFTPDEEVIEFVPLEKGEFEFEHDLGGDTNVNRIAESGRIQKNPVAEI